MGSAEGLLFDVPVDDYDTTLWAPLGKRLHELGATMRLGAPVSDLVVGDDRVTARVGDEHREADACVLAADPRAARALIDALPDADASWRASVAATRNAPPFVVVRLWLEKPVDADRPAFLGTSGYGPLDNVSVLERFEAGAADWARSNGGSVVELHAYACDPAVASDPAAADAVAATLEDELHRVFPETRSIPVLHREVLTRDDCTLITPEPWQARPGVRTPSPRLVLAGDWVRCEHPVALMERAATTGFLAANELLGGWGVRGQDVWTVPVRGLLAR